MTKEQIAREAAEKFITELAPFHADGNTKISVERMQDRFQDAIEKALHQASNRACLAFASSDSNDFALCAKMTQAITDSATHRQRSELPRPFAKPIQPGDPVIDFKGGRKVKGASSKELPKGAGAGSWSWEHEIGKASSEHKHTFDSDGGSCHTCGKTVAQLLTASNAFWAAAGAASSEPQEWLVLDKNMIYRGNKFVAITTNPRCAQLIVTEINAALKAERKATAGLRRQLESKTAHISGLTLDLNNMEADRNSWRESAAGYGSDAEQAKNEVVELRNTLAAEREAWSDQSNRLYEIIQSRDKLIQGGHGAFVKECKRLEDERDSARDALAAEREKRKELEELRTLTLERYLTNEQQRIQHKLLAAQAAIGQIRDHVKGLGERPPSLWRVEEMCNAVDLSALEQHDKEVRKPLERLIAELPSNEMLEWERNKRKPLVEAMEALRRKIAQNCKRELLLAIIDAALASVKEGK